MQVSVGLSHACALTNAGNLSCWGDYSSVREPLLSGGQTWVSISAGANATCGVSSNGTGYCWGTLQDEPA